MPGNGLLLKFYKGSVKVWNVILGGGFNDFLFSPLFGEDSHFDEHIFHMG